jgi:hypothetical protein
MTDETQKLFNAPWTARECPHVFTVNDASGELKAETLSAIGANRLARLPELYDVLLNMAQEKCNEHVYRGENACDDCVVKKYCDVFEIYELLKKVRDGK